MCHHVRLQGRSWPGGKLITARECTGHQAVRVVLCISLFVLYILLISIVVVTVCFIFCSVELPLSQPMGFFCLFLSILLPTAAEGGVVEWPHGPLLPAIGSQTTTGKQKKLSTGYFFLEIARTSHLLENKVGLQFLSSDFHSHKVDSKH